MTCHLGGCFRPISHASWLLLPEYALERLEAGEEDKRTQNAGLDKQRMVEARRTQKAEKRARDQKSSRSAEPQEDTAGSGDVLALT
jgi:hypothetical protein